MANWEIALTIAFGLAAIAGGALFGFLADEGYELWLVPVGMAVGCFGLALLPVAIACAVVGFVLWLVVVLVVGVAKAVFGKGGAGG